MAALLAFAAACAFALGNAMQQRGALRTTSPGEGPRFFLQLFRHPVWLLGGALQGAGFAAQIIALGIGSLLVVQAIIVTNFVIALPFGVWLTDQHVGRRQVLGALVTVAGLVLFLVGGRPSGGTDHVAPADWALSVGVFAAVLAVCDVVARRVGPAAAAAFLGAASGVAFGMQAGLVKAISHVGGGAAGVFSSWLLYVLIVVGVAGFVYQQRGLKVGVLAPTMAAANVVQLVTSVTLGVVLFAETFGRGALGVALAVPGLVLMAAGIVTLSTGDVPEEVMPGVATALVEGVVDLSEAISGEAS